MLEATLAAAPTGGTLTFYDAACGLINIILIITHDTNTINTSNNNTTTTNNNNHNDTHNNDNTR